MCMTMTLDLMDRRVDALISSLTTIATAKPDTDMSQVIPIIDIIFNEAGANRNGAIKAYDLLIIAKQIQM